MGSKMGKRKKKHKTQKAHVTSTAVLDDDRDEPTPIYQKALTEADMEWLAGEYRRRSSSEASLTLEIFADQYGISAEALHDYLPELLRKEIDSVRLWHGTTKSRANSIFRDGFEGYRGTIFFARRTKIPLAIAQRRAANEHDQPVVILCSIDLSRYHNYRQRAGVYVFHHNHIGSEVVQEVMDARRGKIRVKQKSVELTNIGITFNSGHAGVALWINSYLGLSGMEELSEDHEAVGRIAEWLDAQTDAGRFGQVSDEEMRERVKQRLPEYLS